MLLSPIENTADGVKQKRPRLTQGFGEDFIVNGRYVYRSFGMDGHNGVDFGCPIGTPIYASHDGICRIKSDKTGYGKHIKLRCPWGQRETVYAHLSEFTVQNGAHINMGDIIGYSGNTGFSTGPHLHYGLRFIEDNGSEDIFTWPVRNHGNGYYGYVDPYDKLIGFKGTLDNWDTLI